MAQVKDHFGANLDGLVAGDTVGVMVDDDDALHVIVNGVDKGIAARDIPSKCHALIDLYGQCEQVTITPVSECNIAALIIATDDTTSLALPPMSQQEKANIEDSEFNF